MKTATTPGAAFAWADVDRGDLRVCDGAAHHAEEQHAGDGEIVGVSGPTGDQSLILFAEPCAADLEGGSGDSSVMVIGCSPLPGVRP